MKDLTTYAREDDLRAWLASAAPGHGVTYAIGHGLGCHPVVEIAREAERAGTVLLVQQRDRDGRGFRYIARRRADAGGAGRGDGRAAGRIALAEATARVLAVLAARAPAWPGYDTLAEAAGLPGRQAAHYRVRLLEDAGEIAIDRRADGWRVTVREIHQ